MAKKNDCRYCGERPITYPVSECCHACYQWFWYWSRKGPKAVMRRARQLETLDTRMRALMGELPGSNEPKRGKRR